MLNILYFLLAFAFKSLAYVLIIFVLFTAFKELYNYIRLQTKYASQGIKTAYNPIVGSTKYLVSGMKSDDVYQNFRDFLAKNKDHKLIAFNSEFHIGSGVLINDIDILKEFYKKDIKVSGKHKVFSFDILGFVFENGEEFKRDKSIFMKVFHADNMDKMFKKINLKVKTHVESFKNKIVAEYGLGGQKEVDLKKELLLAIFNEVSMLVLLGIEDPKYCPRLEETGEATFDLIRGIFTNFIKLLYDPFNFFSFGLAERFNILKAKRDIRKVQKKYEKLIIREYHKLKSNPNLNSNTLSVLQLAQQHNEQMKLQNKEDMILTDYKLYQTFELFHVAAKDT